VAQERKASVSHVVLVRVRLPLFKACRRWQEINLPGARAAAVKAVGRRPKKTYHPSFST